MLLFDLGILLLFVVSVFMSGFLTKSFLVYRTLTLKHVKKRLNKSTELDMSDKEVMRVIKVFSSGATEEETLRFIKHNCKGKLSEEQLRLLEERKSQLL